MKKQLIIRYLFCAILYLLILWIAKDSRSESEIQTKEAAKIERSQYLPEGQ